MCLSQETPCRGATELIKVMNITASWSCIVCVHNGVTIRRLKKFSSCMTYPICAAALFLLRARYIVQFDSDYK